MAPLILGSTLVSEAANVASDILNKKQSQFIEPSLDAKKQTKYYKWDVVWFNVLVFGYLYTGAIYGMYLFFTSISIYTVLWCKYRFFHNIILHAAMVVFCTVFAYFN